MATTAAPAVARSPRVGYVPARTNIVRDSVAVALLLLALLLPWNLEVGLGVPGTNGLFFVMVIFVTLLAVAAALAPHVGPFRLAAPQPDVRRTSLIRLLLNVAYLVLALGFVGYHLVQTVRDGGTGLVPPGVGPGLIVGVGGALLAAQPPITSITIEDNGFRRWYTAARALGAVSIGRQHSRSPSTSIGGSLPVRHERRLRRSRRRRHHHHTALRRGGDDRVGDCIALASREVRRRPTGHHRAGRFGGARQHACLGPAGIGRDVDAFHGIAQNTSTAAVGYEGYLFWTAAAAIVAPTTLYAVFLIKPPTVVDTAPAAQKCLTLIAFWAFAAAVCRVVDYLIALSLDLPHALYDSVAMTAFNLVTGIIARWLQRQLGRGETNAERHAAFSGALFVFTVANLAIGVALAPRYAGTVTRRRLRQQPRPADHQHVRRGHLRAQPHRPDRHAVHRPVGGLPGAPPRGPRRARAAADTALTWAADRRSTDARAACADLSDTENCSAQGGFDDGDRGATDGGVLRADHYAPNSAPRPDLRRDNATSHPAGELASGRIAFSAKSIPLYAPRSSW